MMTQLTDATRSACRRPALMVPALAAAVALALSGCSSHQNAAPAASSSTGHGVTAVKVTLALSLIHI